MAERADVLLGLLVAVACLFAGLLTAGLVELGGGGVVRLAAMVIGAFSACVYFLAELHRVPTPALVVVTLAVLSTGAFARAGLHYWCERRVLAALPLLPLEGELAEVARAAGARALHRTPAVRPAAFCFGIARPRVVVTDGLLARLSPQEQAAAIWHEGRHARLREPLRSLSARLAARTFFWLPILADVFERYLLLKELDADRLAAAKTSRRALAGALYGVLGEPAPAGAIGLGDLPGARVDRLFDPRAQLPPLTTRRRVLASAASAALLVVVLGFPMQLDVGESTHLRSMLTSMSLHGLPGMAVGFLVNGLIFACMALGARRLLRGAQVRS
ncbi:MAG: M56 family metallopeptidase [Gaiellaceae bacterium]